MGLFPIVSAPFISQVGDVVIGSSAQAAYIAKVDKALEDNRG